MSQFSKKDFMFFILLLNSIPNIECQFISYLAHSLRFKRTVDETDESYLGVINDATNVIYCLNDLRRKISQFAIAKNNTFSCYDEHANVEFVLQNKKY
jgi:hypothetical protein